MRDVDGVYVENGLTKERASRKAWRRFHLKTYRVHDAGSVSRS